MELSAALREIMKKNNGILSVSDASSAYVSRAALSQLAKNGQLERIAHGLYILPDDLPDELYLLKQRSGKIVFSHETALFLHGMAERTPLQHSVTIPSTNKLSPPMAAECKIYYVKPELHSLGKITVPTNMGNMVETYDVERTICDILRSRNRIDDQTLAAAMKNYAVRQNQDFEKLGEYAATFKVTKILRQYMEVLL